MVRVSEMGGTMPDGDGGPIAVGGFLFFSVLDRRKSSGEEYGDDVPGRQDPTNPLSISPSLSLSLSSLKRWSASHLLF